MARDNLILEHPVNFNPSGDVIGGINRADGVYHIFSVDANGQLNVNATFSGSISGNAAAGLTAALVPTSADYIGVNIAGNLVGVTGVALTNAKAAAVAIVDGNGNQITSFGGGTQYADAAASGLTPTGTLSMGWDSALSKVRALKVDASQNLLVAISNFPGTQVVSGTVTANQGGAPWSVSFPAAQHVIIDSATLGTVTVAGSVSITGTVATQDAIDAAIGAVLPAGIGVIGGSDYGVPAHVQVLKVDSSGQLYIGNFPATQAVSGTVTANQGGAPWSVSFPAAQHVIIDSATLGTVVVSGAVDVTDRAARLLGVIYGSQAQQLKQTAVNFNAQVELATGATLYDARQIRALTSADVVTAAQGGAPWSVSFPAAQHVIIDSATLGTVTVTGSVDVTDRAARLLGVVYGSQGQQLKQTATNFNAQVELATGATLYDARQIRALTNADIVKSQLQDNAGTAITVGQKAMASSVPVVIASDQTSIPVSTKTDLTPSAPTAASVGVASALALAANANRKGLHLVNTSGNTISVAFGSAAVLNSGVTLTPYGVFWMDEFSFDTGAVNAIASAAASNLAIQEYA